LKHPVCNWRLSKRLPWAKGNSSLSRLRHFPTDTLKIDRAFISRIDTDADNRAIVRTIVALAHNFGLKVVAEGVETPEEVDELLAIDCEYAQGYFFSRPVDEDTAMHLLSAGHCGKEPFPRRALKESSLVRSPC